MKGGDTDDVAAALEAINGITEKENEKFYEKEKVMAETGGFAAHDLCSGRKYSCEWLCGRSGSSC